MQFARTLRQLSAVHRWEAALVPKRGVAGEGAASGAGGEGPKANPIRYEVPWKTAEYYDEKDLEVELRRVMNVCHGCRRCFSLCQVFPDAFNAVDKSPTQEMDSVPTSALTSATDKCLMCDMCYLTKCPYVPPHPLNIDLPQLVMRQRAVANPRARPQEPLTSDPSVRPRARTAMWEEPHVQPGIDRTLHTPPPSLLQRLASPDLLGTLAGVAPAIANAVLRRGSSLRPVLERVLGVHRNVELPLYVRRSEQFRPEASNRPPPRESAAASGGSEAPGVTVSPATAAASAVGTAAAAPAVLRSAAAAPKVLLYTSCLIQYSLPSIGRAARAVMEHLGAEVRTGYAGCCGAPLLEQGDVRALSERAMAACTELVSWVEQGYTVVTPMASCGLMLRHEWPLLAPESAAVRRVAASTQDVCEWVTQRARAAPLPSGLQPLPVQLVMHHACHARAQNIGFRSLELLRLIPQARPTFIERCSGHGGTLGTRHDYFDTAQKLCKPVAARVQRVRERHSGPVYLLSDCPLAAKHIVQTSGGAQVFHAHPIELLAAAYGLCPLPERVALEDGQKRSLQELSAAASSAATATATASSSSGSA